MSEPVICPYVQPKNALSRCIDKNNIVVKIVARLQALPNFREYKDSLENLLYVTVLIEHLVKPSKNLKDKIDKKALCLEVFEKAYGASNVNKEVISGNIDFLHENKRIKKVSMVNYICGSVSEWFNRKIL